MGEFRIKHPVRRNITKKVSCHSKHREDLRKDFNQRCGYCDSADRFKTAFYEIDHFIPQKILVTISKTDYRNLVYACRSCNNAKSSKWPTRNETLSHDGKQGFMDPCDREYAKQFSRSPQGEIIPVTELGKWMYKELHLFNPDHLIIWNLEQLCLIIEEMKKLINGNKNHPLYKKMCELCAQYHDFDTALRNFQ